MQATVGGEAVDLGTPRQRTLLGLLLIRAGEVVAVDGLADELWDADPPDTARHTIQGYVHRLRQALGPEAWRLATHPPGYQLKVSADEVDAQRFQRLAEHGRRALVGGDAGAADLLGEALALWRGEALADLAHTPAFGPERAHLEGLRLATLEDRLGADLAVGRHGEVVAELERLVGEHPYRERLWGQLLLALYRCGRQADALAAFQRARQVLRDDLGIEPSPWLRRRHELILLQDPALDIPERQPPQPAHNLPAPRTSFVGRRREVAQLHGLLRTRRLVTVTGPPGSGKTRLAHEVAARTLEDHTHGVFLVALGDLDDPRLIPSAIAEALGVAVTDRAPVETLVDHLHDRRLLLVLDNFEHLLAEAGVVAQLLDPAPGLTVLATSRAPLRLSGEQAFPLAPLAVPDQDQPAATLAGFDAVALFAERAVAADPSFRLDAASAPAVAEVVARLDGLPLAIELAAARLRTFPLGELRRRLRPALELLTGGPVDHPARQRTLRQAVAWSDQLLDPAEQALLRRLGVFRGGFSLKAAEAVATAPPVPNVTAGVGALVDASLLQRPADADRAAGSHGDSPARFTMLETIREYALEGLQDAGEHDEVARRHFRYYADLVRQAEPELTRADQAAWLRRLAGEHGNLWAALRWARDAGETDLALDMAGRMWRFWQFRGLFAEGRGWLEDLLAAAPAPTAARARALVGLAGICYWQFDVDTAEAAYYQAIELASDLGEWWLEFEALLGQVATIACHRGDPAQAAPLEERFQALVAAHPEPLVIGYGMATSMLMRLFTGDLDAARRTGEQVLAGARAVGERWYESQALRTLGLVSLLQGRAEHAQDEIRQSLQIAWEIEDPIGLAMDLDRLAQAAISLKQPGRAVVLAAAASELRESVGGGLSLDDFRWKKEHPRDAARRVLDPSQIDIAWAHGRTMSPDEAVAYARAASVQNGY
ncbi:MAG: AAA family ATPase [Actinomycetota bacterium]|nr:AAA family ATPase [Actinomycetota bacterium]